MSIYIDRKYLLLLSNRLDRFAQKGTDLFNFRCPYCGDSQRNRNKARGYIYLKDNGYFFKCHNCEHGTTFGKFLQHMDPEQYKHYALERFSNGENGHSNYKKPDFKEILTGPKPTERYKTVSDLSIESMAQLPKGHYARAYIEARKVPERFFNEIFFTSNYKEFLDKDFPNHGKKDLPEDARIVLLYTNPDGVITNVAGRALASDNKMRYITVKVTDEKKIYGIHRVDRNARIYITEGQFDSLFLPNAVACGDSNLIGLADYLKHQGYDDLVLVFDNQPRNKDIVKQIAKAINVGYNVALLPYDPQAKDINEMVRAGMSEQDVKSLIDENVHSGLLANMKFIEWRKC